MIRHRLEETALPPRVAEATAHGPAHTHAPVSDSAPVPGLYLAIVDPEVGETDPPTYQQYVGPPIDPSAIAKFATFMDRHRNRKAWKHTMRTAETHLTVHCVDSYGGEASEFSHLSAREQPAMRTVRDWGYRLLDNKCQVSTVEFPPELPN